MDKMRTMDVMKEVFASSMHKDNVAQLKLVLMKCITIPFFILKVIFVFILGACTSSASFGNRINTPRSRRKNTQTIIIRKPGFFDGTW